MRHIATLFLCSLLLACERPAPLTDAQRHQRSIATLAAAQAPDQRFIALTDAAKESANIGRNEDAKKFATELMSLLPQFKTHWHHADATHAANWVLGRVAMSEGRVDEGKRYLLESGKVPGSPVLGSFGPNMSLAKDLLLKGEKQVVLEYFELCRKFWEMHPGKLDQWSQEVKDGKIPDFGANLFY